MYLTVLQIGSTYFTGQTRFYEQPNVTFIFPENFFHFIAQKVIENLSFLGRMTSTSLFARLTMI